MYHFPVTIPLAHGQMLDAPGAIIDRDGDNFTILHAVQLHAPDQSRISRAFASAFRFSAPRGRAGQYSQPGWAGI
jgi:hypothetical protein